MAKRRDSDPDFFRKCGHAKTDDNIIWRAYTLKDGIVVYYPNCRQCENRGARSRYRSKEKKKSSHYPCGDPRTEANTVVGRRKYKGKWLRTTRCKKCLEKLHKKHYKNRWRGKPKRRNVVGSLIIYGPCYESDRQCHVCGYMLRMIIGNRCANCVRETTRERKEKGYGVETQTRTQRNIARKQQRLDIPIEDTGFGLSNLPLDNEGLVDVLRIWWEA